MCVCAWGTCAWGTPRNPPTPHAHILLAHIRQERVAASCEISKHTEDCNGAWECAHCAVSLGGYINDGCPALRTGNERVVVCVKQGVLHRVVVFKGCLCGVASRCWRSTVLFILCVI